MATIKQHAICNARWGVPGLVVAYACLLGFSSACAADEIPLADRISVVSHYPRVHTIRGTHPGWTFGSPATVIFIQGRDGRDGQDGRDGVTKPINQQELVSAITRDVLTEIRKWLDDQPVKPVPKIVPQRGTVKLKLR